MKKKRIFIVSFIIIFSLGLIYSGYNIYLWLKSVNENDKLKNEIEKHIEIMDNDSKVPKYIIDFPSLKKQNNDTIAYLKVDNTNISYAIVRGNDNLYYLSHNFNKEYGVAGWIFADYRNKFDETDKNIIIYGHNTNDGSMFGSLKKVLNYEWQSIDEKIMLITEAKTYYYQVFSTYLVNPEDYYITTEFPNDTEYTKFIETIKSRSNYAYQVEVSANDKILTLSTCSDNGAKRVVLHAKLIQE